METFRNVKTVCRDDHAACRDLCKANEPGDDAPPDDGAKPDGKKCLGSCGKDLAACGRDALKQSKQCVRDCRKAPDRAACLSACGVAAKEGTDTCVPTFEACVAGCTPPAPTPTTVPPEGE
jgi:hypothetical protein